MAHLGVCKNDVPHSGVGFKTVFRELRGFFRVVWEPFFIAKAVLWVLLPDGDFTSCMAYTQIMQFDSC